MADDKQEIDAVTGTATTGHVWDGIRELNTPLPRWWLWTFYACIVWAIGYWIVYPAWPLLTSATEGAFGWHSRSAIVTDLDQPENSPQFSGSELMERGLPITLRDQRSSGLFTYRRAGP